MNKLYAVLILAASFCIAQGLQCYVCNTDTNSRCMDPESSGMSPTTCSSSATHCKTYTVQARGDRPNVVRSCSEEDDPVSGCQSTFVSTTCTCRYDRCNSDDQSHRISIVSSAASSGFSLLLTTAVVFGSCALL